MLAAVAALAVVYVVAAVAKGRDQRAFERYLRPVVGRHASALSRLTISAEVVLSLPLGFAVEFAQSSRAPEP